MDILTDFIISFILGLIGIIPALFFRLVFKFKTSKFKAILLMFPFALISLIGVLAILYFFMNIQTLEFAFITMFIIAMGTFQALYNGK